MKYDRNNPVVAAPRRHPIPGVQRIIALSALVSLALCVTARALEPIPLHVGDVIVSDESALINPDTSAAGAVIRVDPSTGQQVALEWGTPLFRPRDAVVEGGDVVIVVDRNRPGGTGGVWRVDPVTGGPTVISPVSGQANFFTGPNGAPTGIAIEEDGSLIVGDFGGFFGPGRLIRVNPATGAQTIFANGTAAGSVIDTPWGLVLDGDGNILAADWMNHVIHISPDGVTQTIVSAGGQFEHPLGIDVADSGEIVVADCCANPEFTIPAPIPVSGCSGAVFRVDPGSGAQTLVSSRGFFCFPRGATVVRDPVGLDFDFDVNGTVDESDLVQFRHCLVMQSACDSPLQRECVVMDFNRDDVVNCTDFEQFQSAWTAGGDPPELPECGGEFCPFCDRGDLNADLRRDGRDIAPFISCLLSGNPTVSGCGCADMNADGFIDQSDHILFVTRLLSSPCD